MILRHPVCHIFQTCMSHLQYTTFMSYECHLQFLDVALHPYKEFQCMSYVFHLRFLDAVLHPYKKLTTRSPPPIQTNINTCMSHIQYTTCMSYICHLQFLDVVLHPYKKWSTHSSPPIQTNIITFQYTTRMSYACHLQFLDVWGGYDQQAP